MDYEIEYDPETGDLSIIFDLEEGHELTDEEIDEIISVLFQDLSEILPDEEVDFEGQCEDSF